MLDLDQSLAGFGDPTVLFIASLFVVSEALDATGVTAWAGQQLDRARRREPDAAARPDDAARSPALTALISVNGAVAALAAGGRRDGVRLGRPPSQLLLPLAFGAHAGSLLDADRHRRST